MSDVTTPLPSILDTRLRHTARNVSLSYVSSGHGPLQIERGSGCYLFDQHNNKYLDCINNVATVGHANPTVVEAIHKQMLLVNTNTVSVNSGSEANDLALRLAHAYTKHTGVVCMDCAYHGHTAAMIACSHYKYHYQAHMEKEPHISVISIPHASPHQSTTNSTTQETTAAVVAECIRELNDKMAAIEASGRKVCVLFVESMLSCAGQIVLPPDYLSLCCSAIHAAGGVVCCDEVQSGLGRNGQTYWEFQRHAGAEPDIVTMGKGLGNGFPVAAVVTTPAIAAAFADTGMEYFNTYGGSHVSCAAGLAVLKVIEEAQLIPRTQRVGEYCLQQLCALQEQYSIIGEVRGIGLFIGVELVRSQETYEAAEWEAAWIVNKMRGLPDVEPIMTASSASTFLIPPSDINNAVSVSGVLLSTDGPHHNVLKVKPPLCFAEQEADILIRVFTHALQLLSQEMRIRKKHPMSIEEQTSCYACV